MLGICHRLAKYVVDTVDKDNMLDTFTPPLPVPPQNPSPTPPPRLINPSTSSSPGPAPRAPRPAPAQAPTSSSSAKLPAAELAGPARAASASSARQKRCTVKPGASDLTPRPQDLGGIGIGLKPTWTTLCKHLAKFPAFLKGVGMKRGSRANPVHAQHPVITSIQFPPCPSMARGWTMHPSLRTLLGHQVA